MRSSNWSTFLCHGFNICFHLRNRYARRFLNVSIARFEGICHFLCWIFICFMKFVCFCIQPNVCVFPTLNVTRYDVLFRTMFFDLMHLDSFILLMAVFAHIEIATQLKSIKKHIFFLLLSNDKYQCSTFNDATTF